MIKSETAQSKPVSSVGTAVYFCLDMFKMYVFQIKHMKDKSVLKTFSFYFSFLSFIYNASRNVILHVQKSPFYRYVLWLAVFVSISKYISKPNFSSKPHAIVQFIA